MLLFLPGVRLYQGFQNRTIPNYAMLAARDFGAHDGINDGINDGLWCQSANIASDIGSWQLPNGSAVPDDFNAIYMTNRPGQVGLLRTSSILISPYQGIYTCVIPDENEVNQSLVVWAAENDIYEGTNGHREFKISLHCALIKSTK